MYHLHACFGAIFAKCTNLFCFGYKLHEYDYMKLSPGLNVLKLFLITNEEALIGGLNLTSHTIFANKAGAYPSGATFICSPLGYTLSITR
jgi:hypothetical protein